MATPTIGESHVQLMICPSVLELSYLDVSGVGIYLATPKNQGQQNTILFLWNCKMILLEVKLINPHTRNGVVSTQTQCTIVAKV